MSGIVGIVNFGGAPVDRALLCRITGAMAFRGPDDKAIWIEGEAGLGFTLLRTADESAEERQPFTFDGKTWIVADARVDGRPELISKLNTRGRAVDIQRPDVELILHAFEVWGEACVEHLLGDFAFAIWNPAQRTLFCARDHMGIKPFYYAHTGSTVIFSNTLDCIRLHPLVSAERNEQAIGDYLLFECNMRTDTTYFSGIQRLAPAHTATWTEAGLRRSQYWTLPVDEPIHYRQLEDYTARFRELLETAVSDRIRTPNAGIYMSGGLDSPAIAATATRLLRDRSTGPLRAFTLVFDGIDQERHYAGLVAKHLDIPIHFRDGNAEGFDAHWEQGSFHTIEPPGNPLILHRDLPYHAHVSSLNRVVLYGEGPDAALWYEWKPYINFLAERKQWLRLIRETATHLALHRRVPLLSTIPGAIRMRKLEKTWSNGYPQWLNPDFEARLDLRERWDAVENRNLTHPARPVGHASVMGANWPTFFECLDAETTRAPLEFVHPYFDIRLLRYLLAVPAFPWCRVKYLIRRSMRGMLPKSVLTRPKAPMHIDPWMEFSKNAGPRTIAPVPELLDYIEPSRVDPGPPQTLGDFRDGFRPRCLNYWLKNADILLE